jgi:hypothetical protein
MTIKVATDFSRTPGARYPSEGLYSGEEFRINLLKPKYEEAVQSRKKLLIDLDDAVGYGTSWLEEAFGGLTREFGKDAVLSILTFKSVQEPYLIDDIMEYIDEA